MAHPFGKPVRAAALCAAHSRATRQAFDAHKDRAGNCVYCSKKERSDELIPTKLYDISGYPTSTQERSMSHAPPNHHHTTRISLTPSLTGAAPQGSPARVHPTPIHPRLPTTQRLTSATCEKSCAGMAE